jgi:hypothetical protein
LGKWKSDRRRDIGSRKIQLNAALGNKSMDVHVPSALAALKIWFVWKSINGVKVPFQSANTFSPASHSDSSTWSTLDEALKAKFPLAFAFDRANHVFGIDIDGCVEDYEVQSWAKEIIDRFKNTYVEYSPSGTGLKIIGIGSIPNITVRRAKLSGFTHPTKKPGIEVFCHSGYFTYTGEVYPGCSLELGECQEELDRTFGEFFPKSEPAPPRTPPTIPYSGSKSVIERAASYSKNLDIAVQGSNGSDKAFWAARVFVQGFKLSVEEAYPLMYEYSQRCLPPWSEKEILHKLQSALKSREGNRLTGRLVEWDGGSVIDPLDFSDFMKEEADYQKSAARTSIETCHKGALSLVAPAVKAPSKKGNERKKYVPEEFLRPDGLIGEIIDYSLKNSLYPLPELALAGALSLMACITGRKVETSERLRTNIYVMGLAPPGSGKEHAQSINDKILESCGGNELIGPESLSSDSALRNLLAQSPCKLIQADEIGRMFQAIKDPGKNPYLFKIGDELLKLFSKSNKVYRGTGYSDVTRNTPIDQPHCVIYGTSVSGPFWNSLTQENVSEGLVGRFMVFEADYADSQEIPSSDSKESQIPSSIIEQVEWWISWQPSGHMFEGLPQGKCIPATIPFSPEAKKRLMSHRKGIEERRSSEPNERAALWSRSAEKACKLALLFACSKSRCSPPQFIDESDMDKGIRLSNFLTRELVSRVYENVSENNVERDLKRVLRMIQDGMTSSQLTRKTQWLKARDRRDIIESLIQTGQITTAMIENPNGRPTVTFHKLAQNEDQESDFDLVK